jgi:peptide/nickel transport system substrate-binding protein
VPTQAPAAAKPAEWTVALTEEPTSFDAAISTYTFSNVMVETHMLENLVDIQGQDLKITPILAESWRTLDPTTWELKLRRGVKFHNGDDFTSDDVKWTMDRMRDPKGQRAYMVAQFESVEAPDPYTVIIKTKAPYGPMIAQLTDIAILPRKAFEAMGADGFSRKPIGTGPYRMVEWVRDQRLTLEANPGWWRGAPNPQRLVFRTIGDPSTRVAELRSGGVQIIQSVPAASLDTLDTGETRVVNIAEGRVMIYPFNLAKKPFDDVRVRQALLYGTDREAIVKSVVGKYGTLLTGPFTSKWMGFDPAVSAYPYDTAKAKDLLAQAGQSQLEFDWNITSGVFLKDKEVAEALASQLNKIGVKMNLQVTERAKIQEDFNSGNFQLTSVAWGTRPDPDPMLSSIVTARDSNTDADVKALIQQGRSSVDDTARTQIYQQVHKHMREQAEWLFVYAQAESFGKRADVVWNGVPTHGSLAINLFYTRA